MIGMEIGRHGERRDATLQLAIEFTGHHDKRQQGEHGAHSTDSGDPPATARRVARAKQRSRRCVLRSCANEMRGAGASRQPPQSLRR
jgi:hypothetical protein